jgi:hypothetical protein
VRPGLLNRVVQHLNLMRSLPALTIFATAPINHGLSNRANFNIWHVDWLGTCSTKRARHWCAALQSNSAWRRKSPPAPRNRALARLSTLSAALGFTRKRGASTAGEPAFESAVFT